MDHPDLVQIDKEQYKCVWALYRTHPTVASCMQTISNFVFGGGIVFEETENVPNVVRRMYQRAGYSALEWIVTVRIMHPQFIHMCVEGGRGASDVSVHSGV